MEVEPEPGLVEDKVVPTTDCNNRSLTNEPACTQYSILETPKVECVVVNSNPGKTGIKNQIQHNIVPYSTNENRNINQPEIHRTHNVKLKYGTDHRRHRRCNTNEAVIIRTGELRNNVCIGYRHPDQQNKTSGDATKVRSIVEAAGLSVHSSGSFSTSSCLRQTAAVLSHPSPAHKVARDNTNAGKAGISSIQSTALINASITDATPNSFTQSKQLRASIATSKSTLNEKNRDAPVDVCVPVAKATWNNLPDSQIVPNSRWQPVNRHVSSVNVDSQLQNIRTSGSNSGSLAKTRLIPIQHISAGRRHRYRVREELYRYSAPSPESHNTQQGNVLTQRPIISASKASAAISSVHSGRAYDKENNYIEPKESQPLLKKHHSLDYDTLNIVPSGSRCQTVNMENLQNTGRRTRPPLPRGSSLSNAQSERGKFKTSRPKSAEFLLEDTENNISDFPFRTMCHVRSPSDGDKTVLLENNTNDMEEGHFNDNDDNVSSDKIPGFFRKMFTFSRRSRSRENKEINTKNRSRSLTSENSSKRSRSLTGSRSRSPSTRSRSPSNTSSMESSESYNNNTVQIVDNKLAAINSRRYLRMYNEIDENRNIDAPSPPIAVWSSDEDITSAPSTPRRKSHGSDHSSQRRVVFRKFSDNRDQRILKTISPELEEQISASLREPSKLKRDIAEITQGEPEALGVTRYRGSPRRHIPNQSLKKYGVNRHHSAENPVPVTVSAPTPTPAPAPVTTVPIQVGPRHPPRGPILQYTRMKNHTIDLSHVIINEPYEENCNRQAPSQQKYPNDDHRHNNIPYNANNQFHNLGSDSSLGCVPQSSTSTAPCFNYHSSPSRTNKDSHPTSEQSDYIARRGIITRTSWRRRSQLSPGDQDVPVTIGLVENISTDSGIQQDSYESSNESLKVRSIHKSNGKKLLYGILCT